MDSETTVRIRTGVFTLVVLLALAVAVLFATREGGLFTPRYRIQAHFNHIEGLTVNAPVWLAGNNIGRVSEIEFLPSGGAKAIRVALELDASVRERIRRDSRASIGTIGLLGDKYVELTSGTESEPSIEPDGVIETAESATWGEVAREGRELLDSLVRLSASSERIVGHFEKEMGSQSIASTAGAVARIAQQVEEGDSLVHALLYDPNGARVLDDLAQASHRANAMLREVEQGGGPLHQLIYSRPGDGAPLASLAESVGRAESVLRKIDEGEGTLGLLVNDPSLYEEARMTFAGARDSALLRTLIEFAREKEK